MWMEEQNDGKFKYVERYRDPYSQKYRRKSTILTSQSTQACNKAQKILNEKISKALDEKEQQLITFHEVYKEWHHSHMRSLRPSSRSVYITMKNHILNYVDKNVLIHKIDTKYLQKFFNQLDYSDEYLSSFKSTLGMVFRYSIQMEYIEKNPIENVIIVKKAKTLEDIQRIENKFLEKDEAEVLLKELYRRPSTYKIGRLAEFMYLTGIRFWEAVILTERDFDFENNLVKITGTIDKTTGYKEAKKGPTKTVKSTRAISLTKRTIDLAKRTQDENTLTKMENQKYLKGNYLFVTKSGTPMQNNSFNIAIKRAGVRVELNNKELFSHIFRHSHVSILAEKNIPLKAIMDRVGHEDAEVTQKIYTQVTNSMKTNIIEQLEGFYYFWCW